MAVACAHAAAWQYRDRAAAAADHEARLRAQGMTAQADAYKTRAERNRHRQDAAEKLAEIVQRIEQTADALRDTERADPHEPGE